MVAGKSQTSRRCTRGSVQPGGGEVNILHKPRTSCECECSLGSEECLCVTNPEDKGRNVVGSFEQENAGVYKLLERHEP